MRSRRSSSARLPILMAFASCQAPLNWWLPFRMAIGAWSLPEPVTWPHRAFALPGFGFQRCRSEEHTSELQSRLHLVCRLLLEKKKKKKKHKAAHVSKKARI